MAREGARDRARGTVGAVGGEPAITAAAGGSRLRLRVRPGAARESVGPFHAGALKVAVAAPPEKGKANRAAAALLARTLSLPRSAVLVVAGASGRDKLVEIRSLPPEEVLRRLR